MTTLVLVCFLLITGFGFADRFAITNLHPVHVSVTNVEHNTENKCLELSVKIFTNDLDEIILKKKGIALNTGKQDENKDSDRYISEYVSENLLLSVNNKDISSRLEFVNKKITEDATWVYMKIKCPKKIKKFSLTNTILLDLFPDQTNLVIIYCMGKEGGYALNLKQTNADMELTK